MRFLLRGFFAEIQHHDHKYEKDHDRAGIYDDLERRYEWCANHIENYRYR